MVLGEHNLGVYGDILVVDDETAVVEVVALYLRRDGFNVRVASDGLQAQAAIEEKIPALVVLDVMLPGLDGLALMRRLRVDPHADVPVILLTARSQEADRIYGLELGADDYVTKPFSPRILVARVRAVLRRKVKESPEGTSVIRIHDLIIDPRRHEVLVNGEPVVLTFTEFGILNYMARRPGWVFTRFQIVDAVKGEDYPVTDRSVDVQIVGLRKKLGSAGKYIETVRGVGYRFKE